MKSLRATITTDQLASILTRCTLIIVDVRLHREISITRRPAAGMKTMKGAWMLYSFRGWPPLVATDALNSFGSSLGLLWLVRRVKHPINLHTAFGCFCGKKRRHLMTWCEFFINIWRRIEKKHINSPAVFSSEPNTCLILIFWLASCLTGSLVDETEDEDKVGVFGAKEDTTWAPVAEYVSDMPAVWKMLKYVLLETSHY